MSDNLLETIHKPIGNFPYIELCNPNLISVPHYHEEIEIAYVEYGSIQAFFGGAEFMLNKENICIFMPGEIHGFNSLINAKNNIHIIKFSINSHMENNSMEKIRLNNNTFSPSNTHYKTLKHLIDSISCEYNEKKTGYEFAIRSYKNQLIDYILRNISYCIIDTSKNIHLLNLVNSYIEKNYANKITLNDIAAKCHFSRFYFSHEFKRISGITFVNYLTNFRLEKATELLKKTRTSITDKSLKCGFENLRSFDRKFMLRYDNTPLEYRKKYIQHNNTVI